MFGKIFSNKSAELEQFALDELATNCAVLASVISNRAVSKFPVKFC